MIHSDERFHVEGETKEVLQAAIELFVKTKKASKVKGYVTGVTDEKVPYIEFYWWPKDQKDINLLETDNVVLLTELVYDFLKNNTAEFKRNVREDDIDGSSGIGWTMDYKGGWHTVFRVYLSYRYYAK